MSYTTLGTNSVSVLPYWVFDRIKLILLLDTPFYRSSHYHLQLGYLIPFPFVEALNVNPAKPLCSSG